MKSVRRKTKNGKKPANGKSAAPKPVETPRDLEIADWLDEAFSGLHDATRAIVLRDVSTFRGDTGKAEIEAIIVHEQLERVRNALIHIDEIKPEVRS